MSSQQSKRRSGSENRREDGQVRSRSRSRQTNHSSRKTKERSSSRSSRSDSRSQHSHSSKIEINDIKAKIAELGKQHVDHERKLLDDDYSSKEQRKPHVDLPAWIASYKTVLSLLQEGKVEEAEDLHDRQIMVEMKAEFESANYGVLEECMLRLNHFRIKESGSIEHKMRK